MSSELIDKARKLVAAPYPQTTAANKKIFAEYKSVLNQVTDALVAATDPIDDDPCDATLYSWDYFRPDQVDGYDMRCSLFGVHTTHKNSETGALWPRG